MRHVTRVSPVAPPGAVMAQPWAPHVACYCDVSASDEAHTAARHALEAMLAAGDTTLLDLVRWWGVHVACRAR